MGFHREKTRSRGDAPSLRYLAVYLAMRLSGYAAMRLCCDAQQPENQPTTPNDMHPIAPQRRPFRPHFTYLYRLVLTRSRAAECRKANHFSAHLALLVGPDTLSRPATTPKFPGGAPAGHGWAPRGAQPALNGARPAHRPAPGNPPGGGRSSRQLSSGRHLIKTHNLQIK